MIARGKNGKEIVRSLGSTSLAVYLKWITDKTLLYSTWNSAQSLCGQPGWQRSLGENG